jgi:hypothetical protein
MSKLSIELEKMIFDKIQHKCTVWYENHRKGGWMFNSDKLIKQRLGWNINQAIEFINNYDWSWIRDNVK